MKLAFVYVPVQDMSRALAFYRDTLGLEELWREGDGTVALRAPDDEAGLMLDLVDSARVGCCGSGERRCPDRTGA